MKSWILISLLLVTTSAWAGLEELDPAAQVATPEEPARLIQHNVTTGQSLVMERPPASPGPFLVEGRAGIEEEAPAGQMMKALSSYVPTGSSGVQAGRVVKIYVDFTDVNQVQHTFEHSGILISPTFVLTTGQAVYRHGTDDLVPIGAWGSNVRVVPAYDEFEDLYGDTGAVQLYSWDFWTINAQNTHMMGLIELDRPVGFINGWVGYGLNGDDSHWESSGWELRSYPDEVLTGLPYDGELQHVRTGFFDYSLADEGHPVADVFTISTGGDRGAAAVKGFVAYGVIGPLFTNATRVCQFDTNKFTQTQAAIQAVIPPTYDLTPLHVQADDTAYILGESFWIDFVVGNLGNTSFNGTVNFDVRVSTDEYITNADALLQTISVPFNGGVWASETVTAEITIPTSVHADNYYLGVQTDLSDANGLNNRTILDDTYPILIYCPTPNAPVLDFPLDQSSCQMPSQVALSWQTQSHDELYTVWYSTTDCNSGGVEETTMTNSHALTNLLPDQTYHWKVKVRDQCLVESPWSECREFTTGSNPVTPNRIAPAFPANCEGTTVMLEWTSDPEDVDYEVEFDGCGSGTLYTTAATTLSIPGLSEGETYNWRVRSRNNCNDWSDWSNCYSFTTAPTNLAEPTQLFPPDGLQLGGEVPLIVNPVTDAQSYEFEVGTSCGTGTVYTATGPAVNLTTLTNGTYHWRARALACGVTSTWSPCWTFDVFSTMMVNGAAMGTGDGMTWANAFPDLQTALSAAASLGDVEIWVAQGTYLPSSIQDPSESFDLPASVQVYGGFNGTETELSQRDWLTNPTVLSGELGGAKMAVNTETIVDASGANSESVLDGFTIDGGVSPGLGGGLLVSGSDPTLQNLVISNCSANFGGGMYVTGNPTVNDVQLIGNQSTSDGGGAWLSGGTYTDLVISGCSAGNEGGGAFVSNAIDVTNLTLAGNSAVDGAGIALSFGASTLRNVLAYDNVATDDGGGIYVDDSNATIVGATVARNAAPGGGSEMYIRNTGNPALVNSIFWSTGSGGVERNTFLAQDDPSFQNCIVVDSFLGSTWDDDLGIDLGGNLEDDPLFVDYAGGDFRLSVASPALSAGDENADNGAVDLDGNPRTSGIGLDMGSYEYACPATTEIRFVDASATGNKDGSSWGNAFTDLSSALSGVPCYVEIWVAAGTYTPGALQTDTFEILTGMEIYGGFAGSETQRDQRDVAANPTILSGELGAPGINDNLYHVVTAGAGSQWNVLDGFTITRGDAFGGPEPNGGGIFAAGDLVVRNCRITDNRADDGGGIYVTGNAVIEHCVIDDNVARFDGGGIFVWSDATLSNLVLYDNQAEEGFAVYNQFESPTFTHVTMAANTPENPGSGSAILVNGGTPVFRNCVLRDDESLLFTSSGTPTFAYSIVHGSGGSGAWVGGMYGTDGGGNVDSSPMFVSKAQRDFRLSTHLSPAFDAGDPDVTGLAAVDLDGNDRVIGLITDMGAYEYTAFVTDVPEDTPGRLTAGAAFGAAYPNPFNPQVTISYQIGRSGPVRLSVYNAQGRHVRTLARGHHRAGSYDVVWKGRSENGGAVASGVYFVRLVSGEHQDHLKVVLAK